MYSSITQRVLCCSTYYPNMNHLCVLIVVSSLRRDRMMKLRTMSHNTPSRQDLYHQYCLLSPMQVTKQDPCI
ncbi:hypothetical protein M8J77_023649 [Diaphorina citri]|nr:hypothetical protein M8J77_023649 [Diaphorina citri]